VALEVALFLAITALLTGACIGVALAENVDLNDIDEASPLGLTALIAQSFAPGTAAVITRRVTTGRVRGLGLAFGDSGRYLAVSYLFPLATTVVAYALIWATGTGDLDPRRLAADGPFESWPDGLADVTTIVLGLTVGVLPFVVSSIGEEVGWRGLMSARLEEVTTLPWNALWTGLAWTAFHLPLIVLVPGAVDGVPLSYALVMFAISLIAFSYPQAWLRQRSGSVWPPVVMHAVSNAVLYLAFAPLTRETAGTPWFGGETGLMLTLTTVVGALVWWRRAGAVRSSVG